MIQFKHRKEKSGSEPANKSFNFRREGVIQNKAKQGKETEKEEEQKKEEEDEEKEQKEETKEVKQEEE